MFLLPPDSAARREVLTEVRDSELVELPGTRNKWGKGGGSEASLSS